MLSDDTGSVALVPSTNLGWVPAANVYHKFTIDFTRSQFNTFTITDGEDPSQSWTTNFSVDEEKMHGWLVSNAVSIAVSILGTSMLKHAAVRITYQINPANPKEHQPAPITPIHNP